MNRTVLARIEFIINTPQCVTPVSHTSSHSSVTVADNTGHPYNCELSIQWAISDGISTVYLKVLTDISMQSSYNEPGFDQLALGINYFTHGSLLSSLNVNKPRPLVSSAKRAIINIGQL